MTSSPSTGIPGFLKNIFYPNISRTWQTILLLPPTGSARVVLQTRQLTLVAHLPKTTCSFLQLAHLTFTNLPFGSCSVTILLELYLLCPESLFLGDALPAYLAFV